MCINNYIQYPRPIWIKGTQWANYQKSQSLRPIYTYVADTFEKVADRNDAPVDTFNRRLEVSPTRRNFYWRWCRHIVKN